MKDLDFDELDKAVNSLVTPGYTKPTPVEPVVVQSVPPAQSAGPSLEPRPSTGRFMDVVHPSSDMRSTLVMPERPSPTTNFAPITKDSVTPNPVSVASPVNQWNNTPNFQIANNSVAPEAKTADKYEDSDIDQINDDITNSLNPTANVSADSPFLSDTKVDKRPLGAFSTPLTSAPTASAPVDNVPTTQETVPDAPISDELQDELLMVESGSKMFLDEPENADAPLPAQTSTPTYAPAPVFAPTPIPTQTPTSVPVPATQPLESPSIAQQYKEQPSSGDQSNGAIYDTNSYNKPTLSPVKKKSGWMWIVWILILLVVGAGAGAAAYFYVLPLL